MKNKDTHNAIKIIFAISIALSFLINAYMFGNEATRRTAEDIVKINRSRIVPDEGMGCKESGGQPQYTAGSKYLGCEY